ncbi:MAG TPA: DUF5985 family protein, partial [Polyangiales bacterium]
MNQFLWGACACAATIIALLFLKFWSQTRDRLFALFAAAFVALAANWGLLGLLDPKHEARHGVYVLRLLGFALIVVAIIVAVVRSRGRRRRSLELAAVTAAAQQWSSPYGSPYG